MKGAGQRGSYIVRTNPEKGVGQPYIHRSKPSINLCMQCTSSQKVVLSQRMQDPRSRTRVYTKGAQILRGLAAPAHA